ncbi:hypothetical protein F4680DRAFT_171816 [Xylaria scruposa]|nr:hypothetical protein F4680DRAFT_171816 [Xylaria scruposa]
MIPIPRNQAGPKPSKSLPRALEDELRIGVLDAVNNFHPLGGRNAPDLILVNVESGCHGTYSQRPDGVQFVFHHRKMAHSTQCKCIVRSSSATVQSTFQLPEELDDHRLLLIFGKYHDVPWRLEPKLAAMVAMKIFLGMEVPDPLGMNAPARTIEPESEKVGELKEEKGVDMAS